MIHTERGASSFPHRNGIEFDRESTESFTKSAKANSSSCSSKLAIDLRPTRAANLTLETEIMVYEPKLLVLETPYISDRSTIVSEVKLSENGLEIIVESKRWVVTVRFDSVWGFRVLDECDLGEFWSECNLTKGWCFEVLSRGWNELEKTRDYYLTGKLYEPREFLLIGLNECVSVLASENPAITELPRSNKLCQQDASQAGASA